MAPRPADAYWSHDSTALLDDLRSTAEGLDAAEAGRRLVENGHNRIRPQRDLTRLRAIANQVRNPLLLILVFAASVSVATGEWVDAVIVVAIVLATVGIGYAREYSAHEAVRALSARVRSRSRVLRDRRAMTVPSDELVVGDVVMLSAGSVVPADGVLLEATDLFVSEAVLTGESFPVEKRPGAVPPSARLRERANCLFLGTNVRSGSARCLILRTGLATELGSLAARLQVRAPETEFDRGIRQFGYLLTIAMLALVLVVLSVHMLNGRPPVETLLFSVALAVGLSPELLPVILSTSLARGAKLMARHGVLVRHLNAIENLGSMDVLCADKTGTLTEGVIELEGAYDVAGHRAPRVLALGALNAFLETGLDNPLDDAILSAGAPDLSGVRKRAEIPFDFVRKRVSIVVELTATEAPGEATIITKGAFEHVLEVCTRLSDGTDLNADARGQLVALYEAWGREGTRVLAVASRRLAAKPAYAREDEHDLSFEGFLTFLDQPKPDARRAIAGLAALGVSVKIITGDSGPVAERVARLVGLGAARVLTGRAIDDLHDEALWRVAEQTDLFVDVEPSQKVRIILALKKMGHVVGFMGDGVNDAPAMHAADTSLAVEHAVDVAREAADFVLLERDLDVVRRGIEEGRITFQNTLKYVLTTMSANLGNMISMAAASVVLPFLPLTAGQILLNNFLSDIPAFGIATDAVDPELVERPRRWSIGFIGRFMLQFGALSSVFDVITFGVLLVGFRASPATFRTGWFVESLLTELVIALVVRTRRPFYRSWPGRALLGSTAALAVVACAAPYVPASRMIGFVPLPPLMLVTVVGITALYIVSAELLKRRFYRTPTGPAEKFPC